MFVSSLTLTVKLPWLTAAGFTLTSPPITIVPVLAFTTTLAIGEAGSTSMFSSKLIKLTFWDGSLGALTDIDVWSSAFATLGPNTLLISSEILLAVVKSPWFKFITKFFEFINGASTILSTVAPFAIVPTVGIFTDNEEPSAPSTPKPPTAKLPCPIA